MVKCNQFSQFTSRIIHLQKIEITTKNLFILTKSVCSELKFNSSPKYFTQPLVATVVTFRMSGHTNLPPTQPSTPPRKSMATALEGLEGCGPSTHALIPGGGPHTLQLC